MSSEVDGGGGEWYNFDGRQAHVVGDQWVFADDEAAAAVVNKSATDFIASTGLRPSDGYGSGAIFADAGGNKFILENGRTGDANNQGDLRLRALDAANNSAAVYFEGTTVKNGVYRNDYADEGIIGNITGFVKDTAPFWVPALAMATGAQFFLGDGGASAAVAGPGDAGWGLDLGAESVANTVGVAGAGSTGSIFGNAVTAVKTAGTIAGIVGATGAGAQTGGIVVAPSASPIPGGSSAPGISVNLPPLPVPTGTGEAPAQGVIPAQTPAQNWGLIIAIAGGAVALALFMTKGKKRG